MKRRKIISLVFVVLLISSTVLMSACSGKSDDEETGKTEISAEVEKLVQEATDRTNSRMESGNTWEGPTTGPKAVKDKKIAFIIDSAEVQTGVMWSEGVKEACDALGWEFTFFDGKNSVQGQVECINQIIAGKYDGIVTSADAESLKGAIKEANDAGIVVCGIHASNAQGADPDRGLYFNATTSGKEIGYALADYAIMDSGGTGRAIAVYDGLYQIAQEKATAMEERIKSVSSMELLAVDNPPLANIPERMPALTSSWLTEYGTPFYVMTIADRYFDFVVPTLKSGSISKKDVKLLGSDGGDVAYQRVRDDDYQVLTIPEPPFLFGYMCVDALNRAFSGEEPDPWQPQVYIVTKENIDVNGGKDSIYDPDNGYREEYKKIWGVN